MSTNETTPFTFDIQESLSFRADDHLQDLIGIALEPDISIQEFEHEISVRGIIELTGEYHPVQDVIEGTAVAVSPGTREIENVEKLEGGTNTFYHRFPVEISVPKYRIKQLKDVYVAIDNFDYDIPGSNVLELHATVAIYGVQEERRQAKQDVPKQPYYPDTSFQQAESAQSYTDEIADQIEAEAREGYQHNPQSYQFFKEEHAEAKANESFANAGDDQEIEAYQFSQEEYAKSAGIEANQEEQADEARDDQQPEEQSYSFVEEFAEPAEAEEEPEELALDDQANTDSGNPVTKEYTDLPQTELETRDDQTIEESDYPTVEEYAETAEAELEEAAVTAVNLDELAVYEKEQEEAEQSARSSKPLAKEDDDTAASQSDTLIPEADQYPEELFVLPDELEDAFQAADFRQVHEQEEELHYLDRELPHEEPAESPDFTFTYQAKQTDEAPRDSEQVTFETPPLLTPEEDDRWKYKETKTLSEFFGSKPVEPSEVPQADLTDDELETEDVYEDVSLQAVPVNQELQPEDLLEEEESVTEEAQAAAERKDSSNFLVHMFGAREETFTKVRVCIVQERDTLEKIATRYDVPVSSIASSNNLEEETVSEGQLLVIPQRRSKKN
ncbi:stage VI sporulation protein D [Terribacillus halophilus]|uniref:Stage VI sporulation protein D n=1 Tax=Terribacillus halophilus TaxID=361279 RepID=A0A1G6SD78_9BACI|nr:LysM peptidoglycan-binding domain-containing protein [Terribacillus halophilus]SDD14107.1 stage VI sporulation protein D [Terribacillus halophilus]